MKHEENDNLWLLTRSIAVLFRLMFWVVIHRIQSKMNNFIRVVCLIGLVLAIVLLLATMGCKTCEPIIEYQEVIVEVPIAVDAPPLPVPAPIVCDATEDGWRGSALFVKECFDSLVEKIEEYHHVITSHNETRSQ